MLHLRSAFILSTLGLAIATAGVEGVSAPEGHVLVVNVLEKTLTIIDPVAGTEVARIPVTGIDPAEVEAFPHEVAVAPDGRTAWVPIYSDVSVGRDGNSGRSITIVGLVERKVIGYVDLGRPLRPNTPAFGPRDGLLYVSTELENSITIIDPKTRKVVGSLPTDAPQSHGMIFNNDGTRIYTYNVSPGSISVIDVGAKKVIRKIALEGQVQRLALSKDGRFLYASDQTKPRIIVIDTAKNQVARYIKAPTVPYALSMSPQGDTLLCALPFRGFLGAVDPSHSEVEHTFNVLRNPQYITFRPDGNEAYVSTGSANAVGIIDLKQFRVRKYVKVANEAEGLAWAPLVKE